MKDYDGYGMMEPCMQCKSDPCRCSECKCGDPDCPGYWTDPVGGVHSCDEKDPAKQYE